MKIKNSIFILVLILLALPLVTASFYTEIPFGSSRVSTGSATNTFGLVVNLTCGRSDCYNSSIVLIRNVTVITGSDATNILLYDSSGTTILANKTITSLIADLNYTLGVLGNINNTIFRIGFNKNGDSQVQKYTSTPGYHLITNITRVHSRCFSNIGTSALCDSSDTSTIDNIVYYQIELRNATPIVNDFNFVGSASPNNAVLFQNFVNISQPANITNNTMNCSLFLDSSLNESKIYSNLTNSTYNFNITYDKSGLSYSNHSYFVSCKSNITNLTTNTSVYSFNLSSSNYSLIYNAVTTETNVESLILNISVISAVNYSSATLFWNNTAYSPTKNNNTYNYSISIPFVPANNTKIGFFWNYTLFYVDGTNSTFTTASNNQTVVWRIYYPELRIKVFDFLRQEYINNFTSNVSYTSELYSNSTLNDTTYHRIGLDVHTNKTFNITVYGSTFNTINSTYLVYYLTNATLIFSPSLSFTFFLINERNNTPLNLVNISVAKLYQDDNSTMFDFKTANVTNTTLNLTSNKIRVELGYADGTTIMRYIDIALLNNNIRICANPEGTTHYEQLIISAIVRKAIIKSIFANCYVVADYTRFAYQDGYVLKAYTINGLYQLYTDIDGVETTIGSLDGSIQSYINLDALEFKLRGYDLGLNPDSLSTQMTGANELLMVYANPSAENSAVNLTVSIAETGQQIFNQDSFSNPNNFSVLFDFSTIPGITENTTFKIELKKTQDGTVFTENYYFNNDSKGAGLLRNSIAVVVSIFLVIFGLTFTVSRITFGWFGLMIMIGAIGVLTFAEGAWYINFFIVVEAIIAVFILLSLIYKNEATLT